MDIPEYYRQFQTDTKKEAVSSPGAADVQVKSAPVVETAAEKLQPNKPEDKTKIFQGNGFIINQLEDWQDKTIYTLTGPVTNGVQHNLIVNVDKEVPFENVTDFAEWQIRTLEQELKGCTLLKKGNIKLNNGTDAYEAIFSWYPVNDMKIYQHQVFILINKTAYKLTASFTKKTRQTLGPSVERMMLSFDPVPIPNK